MYSIIWDFVPSGTVQVFNHSFQSINRKFTEILIIYKKNRNK